MWTLYLDKTSFFNVLACIRPPSANKFSDCFMYELYMHLCMFVLRHFTRKSYTLLIDEGENNWSQTEQKDHASLSKADTSASIDSRASLDTVDSGVPTRTIDDSTDKFYNA